jgi:uncharacterized protein YjbI with pentapeptide repeats
MTDAPVSTATPAELDEARARLEKLAAETNLIRVQLRPDFQHREAIKAYASAASVVTAFVAIVALFVSAWQGLNQLTEARTAKSQERLDAALADLGKDSAHQRLSGVARLRSYLGTEDISDQRDTQVLLVIAHSLAIEESPVVRFALQESIRSAAHSSVRRDSMKTALESLVGLSRGLVDEGRLYRERAPLHQVPDSSSVEARAQAVSGGITSLLRNHVTTMDLSGIYCVRCDFSGMSLGGADFGEAILSGSDFSNGYFAGASFDRADLEAVSFVNANLSSAKLTKSQKKQYGTFSMMYQFDRSLGRLKEKIDNPKSELINKSDGRIGDLGFSFFLDQPNFSCANLQNSDFSGFAPFIFVNDNLTGSFSQSKFGGADLSNARFRSMGAYAITSDFKDTPFGVFEGGGPILGHVNFLEVSFDPEYKGYNTNFSRSLQKVTDALRGSTWQTATWPGGLRKWLDDHMPENTVGREDCASRRR